MLVSQFFHPSACERFMRISWFPAVLVFMVTAACTTPGAPDPSPASTPATPPVAAAGDQVPREGLAMSEFAITMRRGACFGRCPQYSVTVDGGGNIDFTGARFVDAEGPHRAQADMDAVAVLRSKASAVFASIGDVVPGSAACERYATDHPQITLELRTAEGSRTLRHYTGCVPAPAALRELEDLIDRTANVDQWVKGGAPG